MLRLRELFAIPVFLLFLSRPAPAETWKVSTEESNPPYNFIKDGQKTGLDTEIVAAVLKKIGVDEDLQVYPWARVLKTFEDGNIDLIYQLVETPERREKYLLVGPIRFGRTVFFTPSTSSIHYESLDDLKSYTVGVVRDYVYTKEFADAQLQQQAFTNIAALVHTAAIGHVDVAIGDFNSIAYAAKLEGTSDKIQFLPKVLKEVPRYVMFNKSASEKAERFSKGLEELRADGTLDKIIKSWE